MNDSVTENNGSGFFEIAFQPSVVRRATRIAVVVGIVLGLLNHGDAIFSGAVTSGQLLKICLTFLVPYSVSTYSSVLAIRERDALNDVRLVEETK